MRDVLGKMREWGKYVKIRDFPHDCGMVDTYGKGWMDAVNRDMIGKKDGGWQKTMAKNRRWPLRWPQMMGQAGEKEGQGLSRHYLINVFERWCWRRVMRVSWMERNTNVWVLENIKPEWRLESRVTQPALRYFGRVVRQERGMEKDVMRVTIGGKRLHGTGHKQ